MGERTVVSGLEQAKAAVDFLVEHKVIDRDAIKPEQFRSDKDNGRMPAVAVTLNGAFEADTLAVFVASTPISGGKSTIDIILQKDIPGGKGQEAAACVDDAKNHRGR